MRVELYPCKHASVTKTLVFSSGLGGHASFWQPQIDYFTNFFQVLCYDQEGVSKDSEPLPPKYQLADLAKQLIEILTAKQLSHCHFVGHALGAFIGLEVAKQSPQLLDKLVLLNPWDDLDFYTAKCFETRKKILVNTGIEAYVRAQAIFLYPPFWISQHAQLLTEQEDKAIANFPPSQNALIRLSALQAYQPKVSCQNIRHPTLILSNADDTLVPWQRGLKLTQLMINAEFELIATGGHASTITQPSLMNEAIINFFNLSII